MGSRRVFPLEVDTSAAPAGVRIQPPPKSPVHRAPIGNEVARPPTGGSVSRSHVGFDRLSMMKQVNAATANTTSFSTGAEEVSAAVNHRQRMAAEQQRRMEVAMMTREDYTGTPEGQERLQRQEERSRMKEEELLVLRLMEAERQAALALQREKELEEERRVREQYLAKIRAQREQQEQEAREKEEKRKVEMEKKMKALKEAADAKARAEYAAKQSALAEEARLEREKLSIVAETAQMQVEDALGHAMQLEWLAERERQRQIAAEQEEWRLFQERELEKQREATQLRRAAMAQQYEQDKQRRLQIHQLQKERAAQQAERRNLQSQQLEDTQLTMGKVDELKTASPAGNESKVEQIQSQEAPSSPNADDHVTSVKEASDPIASTLVKEDAVSQPTEAKDPSDDQKAMEKISEAKVESILTTEEKKGDENEQNVEEPKACEVPDASIPVSEVVPTSSDTAAPADPPLISLQEEIADPSPNEEHIEESHELKSSQYLSVSAAKSQGLIPFAQILSVMESSPAMQAILQSGDLLVEFGGIINSTPKCLMAIAECVQKNVNNVIPVGLLRSPKEPAAPTDHFEEVRVSLCPQKWKGKGLLGCQLSPFKWPEGPDPPQKQIEEDIPVAVVEETSKGDGGANALVVYEVVVGSVAEAAGFVNGDILAGLDDMAVEVNVSTITAVVEHIRAARTARKAVHFDTHRWIAEDGCYRAIRIVLPAASSGPLGFSLTSFTEYYKYYSSASSTASACGDCYYTTLTTALHAAALSGHLSCLEALLESLLQQQECIDGGYTASDYLDWRDEDGRTPLFYACYAGQFECVQYLLNAVQPSTDKQQSMATNGADLYGDTLLHAATTSGNVTVVALVLESGCVKVDERNLGRLTCAHVAPNVAILELLGEQFQADLLTTDAEERMPLAYACLRNDVESIEYLCKKHPDFVDYADVRGNTPLHVAAWMGFREATEVLLRYLPSIALYITNEDGQNAAEMARSSGMEDVALYLEGAVAAEANPPVSAATRNILSELKWIK